MFAQVIQGRTSDPEIIRTATDRWVQELSPGADGWLGSTAGGADDGRLVVGARGGAGAGGGCVGGGPGRHAATPTGRSRAAGGRSPAAPSTARSASSTAM